MEITQEIVKNLFDYENGKLIRKIDNYSEKAGDIAGCMIKNTGYYKVCIYGRPYVVHKVIYLWHTGKFPKIIDHIDMDKSNNSIENLREATVNQNKWNTKKRKSNTSGYKGVYWLKDREKWTAKICVYRKIISLGRFKTKEEAHEAYKAAALKYHGEFARF